MPKDWPWETQKTKFAIMAIYSPLGVRYLTHIQEYGWDKVLFRDRIELKVY